MKKIPFLYTILIIAGSFFITSCRQGIRMNADKTWEIKLHKGPFALQLTQKVNNQSVEFISKDGASALYYATKEGNQSLVERQEVITDDDSLYSLSYSTTDHRKAVVSFVKGASGILQVYMSVSPSKGVLKTGIRVKAQPKEHFYGLMERTVDGPQDLSWDPGTRASLDLRGQKVTMLVIQTLGIYEPFYVSSLGYGLFVNTIRPGAYDMAATDSSMVDILFDEDHIDISVVPGPKVLDVVRRLPLLTGPAILPPEWAFRPLRWRDEHVNRKTYYDGTPNKAPFNSELVEDILMAKAYDIPIGAYWVDRPWASGTRGYGDLRWDPERFPRAQDMINWLDKQNIKFLVWISPWVCDSLHAEAIAKGYMMPGLRDTAGKMYYPDPWIVDFTQPDATQWWEEKIKTRLINMGIAGFKMDRSEEITPKIDTCSLPNGLKVHDIRNDYPRLYLKAAHDALKEVRGDDFLAMPRAGYTGSQQYGVFWGGDIHVGEYGLRTALIAVQRCSFMNFPFWGSDIGGYWNNTLSHINVARWLAFGAFTPIMEVGPLDNLAPWSMPYTPSYDTTLIAIYRFYSILHDELKNYSHAMARKARAEGMPLVRPLALLYPEDGQAVARWDEYMYGDNILVGIIWKDNQRSFEMYLPKGQWTDYWTGKEYKGNQTVSIECPDYKIPVFLTGDSRPKLPDANKLYRESLKLAGQKPDLAKLQAQAFSR